MKKGFTLIELLAVIVILAIIAVIAVPIVLNIINDAKESATLRSAEFYMDSVEMSIATSVLKGIQIKDDRYFIMEDGNVCIGALLNNTCTGDILKIEVSGNKPNAGYVEIESGSIKNIGLSLSDKVITNNEKEELVFGDNLKQAYTPGAYNEKDELIASWEELDKKSQSEYEMDFKTLIETGGYDEEDTGKGFAANVIESIEGATKLVLADSVTSIGDCAFYFDGNLESVIIPDSVTSIGSQAFYYSVLKNINLPEGLTSLGGNTFECTNLTSIIIPNSLTSLNNSFWDCTSLTTITILNSETRIGSEEFNYCTDLTTIYYKGNVDGFPWGAPNENVKVVSDF